MSKSNKGTQPAKSTAAPAAAPANASAEQTPEQKRAATVASKRQAKIDQRGYALPLALTCHITKKEVKYTSPAYIDKVIAKSPGKSLESLRETFVSREGRRMEKARLAKEKAAAAPAAATA